MYLSALASPAADGLVNERAHAGPEERKENEPQARFHRMDVALVATRVQTVPPKRRLKDEREG